MRLTAIAGLIVWLGLSIQAEEGPSALDVERKLLTIELDSYYDAYEDTMGAIRKLESELAQTTDATARLDIEKRRDRYQSHLIALTGRAKKVASSIRDGNRESRRRKTTPDSKQVYLRDRMISTGRDLDLAIDGPGFFRLVDPKTRKSVYARVGRFNMDVNGQIVMDGTDSALPLIPAIQIPQEATAVSVSSDGSASVRLPGQIGLTAVGQIRLAQFASPENLLEIGENLYLESNASGPPRMTNAGQRGSGTIHQRMIEVSDHERVRELIGLLIGLLPPKSAGETPQTH